MATATIQTSSCPGIGGGDGSRVAGDCVNRSARIRDLKPEPSASNGWATDLLEQSAPTLCCGSVGLGFRNHYHH